MSKLRLIVKEEGEEEIDLMALVEKAKRLIEEEKGLRLEKETQAANRTLIVLPLTPSALSLASASAAAMRREMRSAGGEETLCAADRGASRMLGWGIFLH